MRFARPLVLLAIIGALTQPRSPAADSAAPLARIAFGSSASQEKPQPIWDAVVAAKPDLFLFLGDCIYGDTDNPEVLKAKYAQLAAVPGYQKLLATCPVLATWDDHDYGVHDGGADFPAKNASKAVFLDFFREPADSTRRKRPGVYGSWLFGPEGKRVQVILLDTRYFRSPLKHGPDGYAPNTDPGATILGEEQWAWLEKQLAAPADLRLIGSSIQVVAEDHQFEKWMNFPRERDRLFRLLRDTKANGVVFLSGDRLLGELSATDAGLGYPLFDLTSSGLNMAAKRWRPAEKNTHRVATMTAGDNFGLVAIDWDRTPPRVSLQVRDADGDVAIQQKFDLTLLRPNAAIAATTGSGETAPAAAKPATTPRAVTPAEAAKKVNETVTLEMTVRATGKARDGSRVFLNSANFQDVDNFTVVLDVRKVGDALKAAGVADPAAYYRGKAVRVTGPVTLYREKPQIVVEDAGQIAVVEK
ncbi:MAG TPA: alkaline phosphatase D family protein [Gemmataceae bacterium]|jgi:alkaline phosphatase D